MKRYILFFITVLLALFTGCRKDTLTAWQDNGPQQGTARARVSLNASNFTIQQTRLSQEQEDQWTNVWVAQFRGANPDEAVRVGTINKYLAASGNFEISLDAGNDNIVYFITNCDENPFLDNGVEVSTLAQFKQMGYHPSTPYNDGLTNGGMVMVGTWTGNLASANTKINNILVYVDRLAAKFNVVVRAQQVVSSYFQTPSLEIDSMQLCQIAAFTGYVPDGIAPSAAADVVDMPAEAFVPSSGQSVKTYANALPYYILENLQGIPDPSVTDEKLKNQAAIDGGIADVATHIKLFGRINDGRNSGPVVYKIYLGKDVLKDFNVRRNTNYTLTVEIDGAGIVTSDMRVDNSEVTTLELMRLSGTKPGTTRASETRPAFATDLTWGDKLPISDDSYDHLYMDLGKNPNAKWKFKLTSDMAGWTPTLSYLPPVDGWVPTPNTPPTWKDTWIEAPANSEVPNGARVRINLGVNDKPVQRRVTFEYWNAADPSPKPVTRLWYVLQSPTPNFNMAAYNYIPYQKGTYAVAVRAATSISWKFKSLTSGLKVVGVAGTDGVIKSPGTVMQGHGLVVFSAEQNDQLPHRDRQALVVSSWLGNDTEPDPKDVGDKTVYIYQMASTKRFTDSKSSATARYVYDYSSDPLFETMMLVSERTVEWAINLVDPGTAYADDERLVGASSTTDGKANTWQIYNKLDRYVATTMTMPAELTAPPIFTPAGLCVMMNDDWQNINSAGELKWYLPARYHGLLAASSLLLRPSGMIENHYGSFWTSTGPDPDGDPATNPVHSAYFAGMTVDVSAVFSGASRVRAVRDYDLTGKDKTYPYVYVSNGNPIVVTREQEGGPGGAVRGFNGTYTDATYKLGAPKRYYYTSSTDWGYILDGPGPTSPLLGNLSTRFQVAKKDAPMTAGSKVVTGPWRQAAGYTSNEAVESAQTGCAIYNEGGYTDWRTPTELEMRIILLLGGGTGTTVAPKLVPVLQAGTEVGSFTNADGYTPIGPTTTTSWGYWTNRNHTDPTRAEYIAVGPRYVNGITGSATDKKANYRVRCVRDLELYEPK